MRYSLNKYCSDTCPLEYDGSDCEHCPLKEARDEADAVTNALSSESKTIYWVEILNISRDINGERDFTDILMKYPIAAYSSENALELAAEDKDWICGLAAKLYDAQFIMNPEDDDCFYDALDGAYDMSYLDDDDKEKYAPLFEALSGFVRSGGVSVDPLPDDLDEAIEVWVRKLEVSE